MARHKKRDYYQVLGVDRNADEVELKRVYRELARKYHPDINQGDAETEDRFKEVNEAYAVLSDARARARYDRFGFSATQGGQEADGTSGFSTVVDAVDDMLGDLIGDAWRRRRQRKRGRELRYTLEITFEEAVFGCQKTIHVPHSQKAGESAEGRGEKSAGERSFTVTIPPGTKEGAVKMIKGEGEPGIAGAPPGDLHVIVRIKDHPIFHREGHDVWCEVPISFVQAALGALIEVPTIDARIKMRVPEGTQSGRVFRVRGKGIPRGTSKNSPRGDQLVKIVIETPTGLTPRQRDLLEQLARESGDATAHPQRKAFVAALDTLFPDPSDTPTTG